MSQEMKAPSKKPQDAVPWTPIPELARWERTMEQMFGETTEKKKATEKKKPLGDAPQPAPARTLSGSIKPERIAR